MQGGKEAAALTGELGPPRGRGDFPPAPTPYIVRCKWSTVASMPFSFCMRTCISLALVRLLHVFAKVRTCVSVDIQPCA